jgi:hypothetical protein
VLKGEKSQDVLPGELGSLISGNARGRDDILGKLLTFFEIVLSSVRDNSGHTGRLTILTKGSHPNNVTKLMSLAARSGKDGV